ncbi:hypothetical protein O5O45_04500 [Hahella aquimaris]|uniref:SMP-30/gluconolactonase/LRE family protein n=1 Tax=Hahella sp. HNIBRBA332 TaxID=3015983 RepID=UPI00273B9085|nr:hypothetical protein [Hahella sp. HNIBRBA332]WLQ15189.1 hypothetical protein O5O45_04500 [Hahella sp. HNIBRBA332]
MHARMLSLLALAALPILASAETAAPTQPALQNVWTASGFDQPESAIYDRKRHQILLSSMNGSADAANGMGYISVLTEHGDIVQKHWVQGLNAPKGMGIHGDHLYVADLTRVLDIDITTGKIAHIYDAPEAQFLNDVTVTDNGDVYISDLLAQRIYRLHQGVLEIWLSSAELNLPNGLWAQRDRLLVAAWGQGLQEDFSTRIPGRLKQVQLSDKHISDLIDDQPLGNLDGVTDDGANGLLATDFMRGRLFYFSSLTTAPAEFELPPGSADLDYIPEQKLVLMPLMWKGELAAYRLP